MKDTTNTKICAIYTRKSCEDGLELEYNSLDAQYDAAASYVRSQIANGWQIIPKRYDDGGFSGGNMERPALKELIADIESNKIDIVVVYKIDRLSRSLCDFTDLSKLFEEHGVSFVSVTQQIDTSNAAGRMMLNILMSFAQFEREMTADRIRDKVYATRKKGMWSGGPAPLGYRVEDKKLVIDEQAAPVARFIFTRYAETGSVRTVISEVEQKFGLRAFGDNTHTGSAWHVAHVYRILHSVIYKGDLPFRRTGETFHGVHEPLVSEKLWNDCQRILSERAGRQPATHRETTAALKELLKCGHCGGAMAPVFSSKKGGMRYSYYRCSHASKYPGSDCPIKNISGELIERQVIGQLGTILCTDEFMRRAANRVGCEVEAVRTAFGNIPSFINGLFPAERDRLLHCLVDQVVLNEDGIDIDFKTKGMEKFIKEMTHGSDQHA